MPVWHLAAMVIPAIIIGRYPRRSVTGPIKTAMTPAAQFKAMSEVIAVSGTPSPLLRTGAKG